MNHGERSYRGGVFLLWMLAVVLGVGSHARADSKWNVSSGNWITPGNWLPASVPGAVSNTLVDNSGLATVTNAVPSLGSQLLYVGSNSSGNRLVVTNGGTVSVGGGYVGLDSGSANNSVTVTGSGSQWRIATNLFVGLSGPVNRLIITNGGRVTNVYGSLGFDTSSTNNVAVVAGTGSVWQSEVYVGYASVGNQLLISGGGLVTNATGGGYVGIFAGSTNNTAMVSGTGSAWQMNGNLYVGFFASGNRLALTNGGTVQSAYGYVGFDVAALSNLVTVTGAGSLWRLSNNLSVGYSGSGNQLIIASGGIVSNAGNGFIGSETNSFSNRLTVSGTGSVWRTPAGQFRVGSFGAGNQLLITNGGLVISSGGYVGHYAEASNNIATVTGAGSEWRSGFDMSAGYYGSRNQLIITNGGSVSNTGNGYVGYLVSSSNNSAIVAGSGSIWRTPAEFAVGYTGPGNQLLVTSGGTVSNGSFGYVGLVASSSNNTATVNGAGSVWRGGSHLFVGFSASGNRLNVTNGGTVIAGGNLTLGNDVTSSNNVVVITDAASSVNVAGAFTVRRGTNYQLGGTVTAGSLVVTNSPGSYLLRGGTLTLSNSSVVNNGSGFSAGNGVTPAVLNLVGGTHGFSNGLTIALGSTLGGTGVVNGVTTFHTNAVLAPGNSGVGTLTFNTNVTLLTNAVYQWEAGAVAQDRAVVGGVLTLPAATNWMLKLVNAGLTPSPASAYVLFTAGSIVNFSTARVKLDYGSTGWSNGVVSQVGNQIVITNLTAGALTAFQKWQTNHFGTTANPNAGYGVDPDGDGIVNGLEYAFGTAPTNRNSRNLPVVGRTNNFLSITFARATNATDLIYTVQESTNLLNWLTVTNLTATNLPLGAVTVKGTNVIGAAPKRDYLRVKVTLP